MMHTLSHIPFGRLSRLSLLALFVAAGCQATGEPATETIQETGSAVDSQVIETPNGPAVVSEVEFSDHFPPGCAESAISIGNCNRTVEGYQFVIVWLEAAPGSEDSDVGRDLFDASEEVYLLSGDGSRTWRSGAGILADRPFVSFAVAVSDGGYSMIWPRVIDLRR